VKVFEAPLGFPLERFGHISGIDLNDTSLFIILPEVPALMKAEELLIPSGIWGMRLLTFGDLAGLVNARWAKRHHITRMARLFLMEEIAAELRGSLSYYREIGLPGGLAESMLRLIAELKQVGLLPSHLFELAGKARDGVLSGKLLDAASFFERYEERLHKGGYADDIDLLRLAAQAARSGDLKRLLPDAKGFLVFGFIGFTQVQLELLKCLDDYGFNLVVCIETSAEVPQLRGKLCSALGDLFGSVEWESIPESSSGEPAKVEIFSFPSFMAQADFVGKEVRMLAVEDSIKPKDIAILLRRPERMDRVLAKSLRKFGVPFSLSSPVALRSSPLGRFVLDLLRVKSSGFERDYLFRVLRSPFLSCYFSRHGALEDEREKLVAALDAKSKSAKVLSGAGSFLMLIGDLPTEPACCAVSALIEEIEARFEGSSIAEHAEDLGRLLDYLLVADSIELLSSKNPTYVPSWRKLFGFLRELRLFSRAWFARGPITPASFSSLVEDLLTEESFVPDEMATAASVRILGAKDCLGTSFKAVFLLDAGEGEFPLCMPSDPIIRNDERVAINELAGRELFRVAESHNKEEELLFEAACGRARERLYILYSMLDEKGRVSLPSHMVLKTAKRKGIEIERKSARGDSAPEGIFARGELVDYIFSSGLYEDADCKAYLSRNFPPFRWVLRGICAERNRLRPHGVPTCFEGVALRAHELGADELTPTGLETYGACPFRYFASNVLGLEAPEEATRELKALEVGSIYHEILNKFFTSIAGELGGKVDLSGKERGYLSERFKEFARSLDIAPRLSHLPPRLAEILKKRMLEEVLPEFVALEEDRIREWGSLGFYPSFFELDVSLALPRLTIRGKVDRVDVGGDRALVIDYKLRSGKEFFTHSSLQLPLYLSSLRCRGFSPHGGYYRFIERPEDEKGADAFRVKRGGTIDEFIHRAERLAQMYAELIRAGFFPPVIADKAKDFLGSEVVLKKDKHSLCAWCEFKDLCRVKEGTRRKLECRIP
jgi:ATP-dependent helicase/DNAse subunit B